MIHASIRGAFEQRLEAYEFLGSAEAWQQHWRPETREFDLIAVYPWNLRGVTGVCRDVCAALRRRAVRQLSRQELRADAG
jgi:hypothetical protein